jgi:hypothetical protein
MPDNEKFEVKISPRADRMMQEHILFLDQVSVSAAERLLNEYAEKVADLDSLPMRYPYLEDPNIPPKKYRKLLLAKQYLVLFQVKGKTVYVEYVIDCRSQYQWLIG